MLKKIITTMLIVSMLPINVFAASPQTKQMIHDTLSKFCIPPKKENCNPREEGQYDPNYDFCLCEDDGMVYSKSERKCVEVPAGTYYQKSMKTNIPKKCEPGTYSRSGTSGCISCSAGTYQDEEGQSSCKDCKAGTYSTGRAASCDSCSAGSYSTGGASSCTSCEAGKYQPYSGQSKCETCDANACYKVTNNRTKCEYDCRTPNLTVCSRGTCVQCTDKSHCSGTDVCKNHSCVDMCSVYDCDGGDTYDEYDNTGNAGNSNSGGGRCKTRACRICAGIVGVATAGLVAPACLGLDTPERIEKDNKRQKEKEEKKKQKEKEKEEKKKQKEKEKEEKKKQKEKEKEEKKKQKEKRKRKRKI